MWLLLNKQNHVFRKLRQDKKWFVWEMVADLLGLLQLFPSVVGTKPLQINQIHVGWALLPTQRGGWAFPALVGKQLCQGSLTHAEMLLCLAQPLPVLDCGLVLPISAETNLGDVSLADNAAHVKGLSCCSPTPHHSLVCLHFSPFPHPRLLQPWHLLPYSLTRPWLFLVLMTWEGLSTVQGRRWRK